MMQTRLFLLMVLLGACGDGPNEETLIDELQIIGAQLDNPAPASGQAVTVSWAISQPKSGDVAWRAWTCTPLGFDACVESSLPQWPSLDGTGTQPSTAAVVPALPEDFPAGAIQPFVTLNMMACDNCDLSAVNLANPDQFASQQTFDGFTWATLDVPITTTPDADSNPTLVVTEPSEMPPVGQTADYLFTATDDDGDVLVVWLYATAGGWNMPSVEVGSTQEVTASYFPDEDGADALLWAVVTQRDRGLGTTWWQGTYTAPQ